MSIQRSQNDIEAILPDFGRLEYSANPDENFQIIQTEFIRSAQSILLGHELVYKEHRWPISATVERGARCMSACVFVLAGAEKRRIDGAVGIQTLHLLHQLRDLLFQMARLGFECLGWLLPVGAVELLQIAIASARFASRPH
jgi:hypothetical protein